MSIVIGLDLGTTNTKAVALTHQGEIKAVTSRSYRLHTTRPSWVEQDPGEVWEGVLRVLSEIARQVPISNIIGICLSGAMHSLFPIDQKGSPLALAMTWADQRAAPLVPELRKRVDTHALYLRTGCPVQAIYHIAKLRWWLTHQSEIQGSVSRYIAIKDYVLFKLTGELATDLGLASSTGLFDIYRQQWDLEALTAAGVTAENLAPLVSPTCVIGKIKAEVAQLTGLTQGLPIFAGSCDGGLANLGTGAYLPDQCVITVGTSGAIRRVVTQPLLDEQERTFCYLLYEDHWFAGGGINNAGLALQWVRENYYLDLPESDGYRQIFQDVAALPPGADGVVFFPYFTGERSPYWNTSVRAIIAGLGLEHGRRHIARAVLEGIAISLEEVWEALVSHGLPDLPVLLTGGITQSPVWAQIVCDVLGVPMAAVEAGDASAVGAAILGHFALGNIASVDQISAQIKTEASWAPDPGNHAIYHKLQQKSRILYQTSKQLSES